MRCATASDRIDAVEIDPVIQRHRHPSAIPTGPTHDPRVVRHLDDGRHFLRTTDRKYDLVVYALVDSLILHSGYANIRSGKLPVHRTGAWRISSSVLSRTAFS